MAIVNLAVCTTEKEFMNNVSDKTLKISVNIGIPKKLATNGEIKHNIPQQTMPIIILNRNAVA